MYTEQQKRDNIKEVQTYLHRIAQQDKRIPVVIPDGIYGDETERAVKAFQRLYGLPETGEVDKDTWDRIVEIYLTITAKPEPINAFPSSGFILREGDTGPLVYLVQIMLDTLAKKYNNLNRQRVNGVYGSETTGNVKEIQKNSRLEQTGDVNRETWNSITAAFNTLELSE